MRPSDSANCEVVGSAGRVHSAMRSSEPARKASRQTWRCTLPLDVFGRVSVLINRIAWTSMPCCSATDAESM